MRLPSFLALLACCACATTPGTDSIAPRAAPSMPADSSTSHPADAMPAPADSSVWTAGRTVVSDPAGPPATLRAFEAGRHAGYDRVVLTFEERVPSYQIEYVDRPAYRCGSGEPVYVDGDGYLQIDLTSARAHTEAGTATISERDRTYELPVLKQAVLTCDFEGHVTWLLGLAAPNRYRAFTLDDPARLVVDVRH